LFEFSECRLHHFLNAALAPHIAGNSGRFDAQALQFLGGLLAPLYFSRAQYDVSAHLGQALSHLAAESDGTSRDDGHSPGEVE
jgi:hypothetical protein